MLGIDDINRLQVENAELKAYKDVNEDFKIAWEELKAENERLKDEIKRIAEMRVCYEENLKLCKMQENHISKLAAAIQEIQRVINLAHRVEDYLLGQDYTDLVDRINKELGVLKNEVGS